MIDNTNLYLSPTLSTAVGPYAIKIKLDDGHDFTEYPITFTVVASVVVPPPIPPSTLSTASSGIVVTNSGPPVYSFEPPPITLDMGQSLNYTLPPITDPDGDQFTIDVYLGVALLFTEYSPFNRHFTFNPTEDKVWKS